MRHAFACASLVALIISAGLVPTAALADAPARTTALASDGAPRAQRPMLALVIDDLGWHAGLGNRVLELPPSVTVAVLPDTPAGIDLALRAQQGGHEVILHQPMEALDRRDPGPGALRTHHRAGEIRSILAHNIAAIPGLSGVSNHMGSGLTGETAAMAAVMETVAGYGGLYFLDSRTTADSVALQIARTHAIPSVDRDVFLDTRIEAAAIESALDEALALAEGRGHAIAIGHPHPETLAILEARMHEIIARVELVPVSRLASLSRQTRDAAPGTLSAD